MAKQAANRNNAGAKLLIKGSAFAAFSGTLCTINFLRHMVSQKDFKLIELRIIELFKSVSLEPFKSKETIQHYLI